MTSQIKRPLITAKKPHSLAEDGNLSRPVFVYIRQKHYVISVQPITMHRDATFVKFRPGLGTSDAR